MDVPLGSIGRGICNKIYIECNAYVTNDRIVCNNKLEHFITILLCLQRVNFKFNML